MLIALFKYSHWRQTSAKTPIMSGREIVRRWNVFRYSSRFKVVKQDFRQSVCVIDVLRMRQ